MEMLSNNIGLIKTHRLAKNPAIIENVELKAHGLYLMLTLLNFAKINYHFEVLNLEGELLIARQLKQAFEAINCFGMTPNTYLLNLYRSKQLLYSFQLAILNNEKLASR